MSLEDLKAWSGRRVLVLTPTPTHPIDFGNRKRVHAICARLKDLQAEVHLLHYASETDWRVGYPIEQQRQMSAAWDSYSTVFPTRAIHPPPQDGFDHEIDEWWDPAIGQALSWLFSHHAFDAFIVNYPWLSRALEFAPRHTLRILDTHDRFSGRREMLQAHGIAPEFFHVTVAGERAALDRADVVWAIKAQEAEYFGHLTGRPITVMPHADRKPRHERVPPAPGEDLALGIVGARNNINQTNIRQFARVAAPIFSRWLAPLTVRIAGSVCDLLPDDLGPYFERIGMVEDLSAFYATLDAAIVPMSFSTGLKIKVSEALALGLPVISHVHAFEGFKSCHPAQVLPDFEQIAETCVELAYDRTGLAAMAAAARRSEAALEATVSAGFADTGRILASFRPRLLVLASVDSVAENCLQGMWLASCLPFLSAAAQVTLLLSDADAAAVSRASAAFRRHGVIVVGYPSDGLAPVERADRTSQVLEIARRADLSFVIDDAISRMAALPVSEMHVCVVLDVLGFGVADLASSAGASAAAKARKALVLASDGLTPDHLRLMTSAGHGAAADGAYGLVPIFSDKYLDRLHRLERTSGDLKTAAILSPVAGADLAANAVGQLLSRLRPDLRVVVVRSHPLRFGERRPQDFLRDWVGGLRVDLVVDLDPGAPCTAALRELALRRDAVLVDRYAFSSVETYASESGFAGLVDRLLQVLGAAASGVEVVDRRPDYDNEAGWAWLWDFIGDPSFRSAAATA